MRATHIPTKGCLESHSAPDKKPRRSQAVIIDRIFVVVGVGVGSNRGLNWLHGRSAYNEPVRRGSECWFTPPPECDLWTCTGMHESTKGRIRGLGALLLLRL